jgi:hypothetical protein
MGQLRTEVPSQWRDPAGQPVGAALVCGRAAERARVLAVARRGAHLGRRTHGCLAVVRSARDGEQLFLRGEVAPRLGCHGVRTAGIGRNIGPRASHVPPPISPSFRPGRRLGILPVSSSPGDRRGAAGADLPAGRDRVAAGPGSEMLGDVRLGASLEEQERRHAVEPLPTARYGQTAARLRSCAGRWV